MPMLHDRGGGVELRVGHEVLSNEAVVLVVGGMDDFGDDATLSVVPEPVRHRPDPASHQAEKTGVRRVRMWPGGAMRLGVEHLSGQPLDLHWVAVLDQLRHHLAFDPVVLVELGICRLPQLRPGQMHRVRLAVQPSLDQREGVLEFRAA